MISKRFHTPFIWRSGKSALNTNTWTYFKKSFRLGAARISICPGIIDLEQRIGAMFEESSDYESLSSWKG